MAFAYVPGYTITFTIGGEDLSVHASSVALSFGAATLPKPVFGTAAGRAIAGQATGTFNASGHGNAEALATLAALRAQTTGGPVPVVLTYGDGGNDAFDLIVGEVTTDAEADGQLSWTLTGSVDGDVTYTPPAGP